MLTIMRPDQEKTVMGLMALLPGLKEIDHLQAEMAWYANDPAREIYTWHEPQSGQVQGVIGIERYDDEITLVRHISLSPEITSDEHLGALLSEYKQLFPTQFIMGTLQTQAIINQWSQTVSPKQV